jgi:hypothetical protein
MRHSKVTVGRIVLYRSEVGDYSVPAIITATEQVGNSPPLTEGNVHLMVFTPTLREDAGDPEHPRAENVGGTYAAFDVPHDAGHSPRTWDWPPRV